MAIRESAFYRWKSEFAAVWYKRLLEGDFDSDYIKGATDVLKSLDKVQVEH